MDHFRRLDVYRKVPSDLTQPTTFGAIMSLLCISFIALVLGTEIYNYLNPELTTQLLVDDELYEQPVQVLLNITFPRMECTALDLDLQDDLGRHDTGLNGDELVKTPMESKGIKGCNIYARFYVNKVPGNFHLSTHHAQEKEIQLTQPVVMAHELHQLFFGDRVPEIVPGTFSPVNGKKSLYMDPRTSHDYFLKVVPTIYEPLAGEHKFPFQYSFSYKSYKSVNEPMVAFRYDLSPITIKYVQKPQNLYSFLGRVVALCGGTYTVASIIDSLIFSAGKAIDTYKQGKFS